MTASPLPQAVLAAFNLTPAILREAVLAEHAGDRTSIQRRLRRAVELARELLTRLEVAETEFAATPLDHAIAGAMGTPDEKAPAIDSAAWTGRGTGCAQ
jgi:hypothetical protein